MARNIPEGNHLNINHTQHISLTTAMKIGAGFTLGTFLARVAMKTIDGLVTAAVKSLKAKEEEQDT